MIPLRSAPGRADPSALLGRYATRFELESRLGAGANAVVFRAFDRTRGAQVALKVPHAGHAAALLALKDEFRTLAAMSHANVVAFHELFVTDDAWFFTMQLVRGVDALSHVRAAGQGSAVPVLEGLAAGLAALHAEGILHRDLKPSNAWVSRDGVPVLLDFGLALDGAPGSGIAAAGTPAYLAPELAHGAKPSTQTDVYALGVLAHEMVLGARPSEDDAGRLADRAPHVPEALADLIESMLDRRPERRPSAAAIHGALGGTRAPADGRRIVRPLPDRDGLASALAHDLSVKERGRPVVRFVHGPAGIGKTALLERALEMRAAQPSPPLLLRARCSEHERVPFAALDPVVDHLARHLASDDRLRASIPEPSELARIAEAFPVMQTVIELLESPPAAPPRISDPWERRERLGRALALVTAHVSTFRGVVIAIDDLQWADEDGVSLLRDVLRGLGDARVAIVATHRDEAHTLGPLRSLEHAADVGSIAVPALSRRDASALAEALGADAATAEALVHDSAGSPFLLETLALDTGAATRPADETPDARARHAIARRLASLAPAGRAVLETVCVAAHPLALDVAARAAGTTNDLGTMRALANARLLRSQPSSDGGAEVEAYHDRLREIVVAAMDDAARGRVHVALARALEHRPGAHPMHVCLHLAGAGELERAATFAETGARRAAAALAFARAADLFRFALAHRSNDARAAELGTLLGDALANAGRGHEAARAYLDAAGVETDAGRRLDLRRRAAEHQLRSGFFAEGTRSIESVLRDTGVAVRRSPREAFVSLVRNRMWLDRHLGAPTRTIEDPSEIQRIDACFSAAVGLSVVDSIRSADLMTEALRRSIAIGDRRRLAASLGWYAAFVANGGARAEPTTRAILARAKAMNESEGDAYARGCYEAASALCEFHLGNFARARDACARADAIFVNETVGTTKELSTVHTFDLAALAQHGRLRELALRLEMLERVSEARGERYALSNYRQGLMILRWLAADDPARARSDLALALADFDARGFVVQHWFDLWGRVTTDLYEGHASRARALYRRTRGRVLRSLLVRTQWVRVHLMALDAATAIACMEEGSARAHHAPWVQLLLARMRSEDRPWTRALASAFAACARAARGDVDGGRRDLARAIPELDAAELGLYAGAAHALLAPHDPIHRAASEVWATRERVARPDLLARALLPGFGSVTPR